MNHKEMRQELRDAGKAVPRSNKDLEVAYNKNFHGFTLGGPVETKEAAPVVKLATTNEWTYIGAGDEPPHMINFMGMQKFVRGQATPVTNSLVIEKIANHRCFVKGKVDQKVLFESDEQAKKEAQDQRDEDVTTQIMVERKNRGK